MKKLQLIFAALVMLLSSVTVVAQQKKAIKYKKAETGAECAVFDGKKGARIKEGDVVFLNLKYANSKDSVLFDSWKMGGPLQIQVTKPAFQGDLMCGLMTLTNLDSANFLIDADSLFAKTFGAERPDFINKGSKLEFTVKVNKVMPPNELKIEDEKTKKKKEMFEKADIEEYIKKNNLTVKTTESGLMYIITKEGTGVQATAGKTVSVHYTGKLLDGTKFDSSRDRNEPLEFTIGRGMVIKGWDEGIALMKVGGTAILIIPSELAYGSRGAGGVIPPYTPLTFEVELVDVK